MALVLADRVQQTGTANTTVSFTLSGAVTGFQSLSVVGNGNTTYYAAFDTTGNWETGLGTYTTAGTLLTRTTIYASSNSGSAVTFSGTVNVFVTYPAGRSVNLDASNNVSALGTIASGTWQGSVIAATYGGSGVAGTLTGLLYGNGTGAYTVATTAQALTLIGTVPIANGGTNSTATATAGGAVYGTGTAYAVTAAGTSGNALISAAAGAPAFGNLALGTANTNVSGTLTPTNGGTGVATLTGFAYGNGTSAFTVATTAQVLTLIGTLPIANGGTNSTATATAGGVGYGTGTAHAYTAAGTSGQPLISAAAGAPAFGTLALGTANTNVSGTLTVTNGGTGVATLTGIVKGTGTTAFTAATSGTDYSAGTSALGTGILKSTTTTGALTIAVAADFPTLNQNTTGTAANVTGTVALLNGGSGQTTAQAAMNAFAGAVTSGSYLRGNGTNVVMNTIQAADVPTLNQNTTGSAATFTSTSQNSQFNSVGVGTAGSTTAGEIRATNNITAYYTSDRRFKENIQDIPNALEIASSIGSKTFDWTDAYIKAHGGEDGYFVQKSDFGVIAQDVQAVFPKATRIKPDGTLAVDYEKLGTLAFAAIGQLLKRVEILEAR
jgi:hypothetical protein